MQNEVKPTSHRRRPVGRPISRRPGALLMKRLAKAEEPSLVSESGLNRRSAPKTDEPLSIPPTSSSSADSQSDSDDSSEPHVLAVESIKRVDEAGLERVAVEKAIVDPLNESLIVPSSALAQKARAILERELMFEKLIAQSKAELAAVEDQINDLGTGYVAVSRCVTTKPPRRLVELPTEATSPGRVSRKAAIEALDENFSRVMSSRPPLPPRSDVKRLSDSKPLLTNVPLISQLGLK